MSLSVVSLCILYFVAVACLALILFEGTVRAICWLERKRDRLE